MLVVIENLVYYTIGTGIGENIQRGNLSVVWVTEMGHYYVARHPMDIEKSYGVCPFHMMSEGYAAGPSLKLKKKEVYVGKILNLSV